MIPPMSQTLDDNDLDDEALWAVIDSAVASSSSAATKSLKSVPPRNNNNNNHRFHSPKLKFPIISNFTSPSPSPSPSSSSRTPRTHLISNGEEESYTPQRPSKIARLWLSETASPPPPAPAPLVMVKHVQRTPPTTPAASSCSEYQIQSPTVNSSPDCSVMTHSLSGRFPTVALFKEYQNAAMAILEKGDYTLISGNPFIKKSGWRKISCFFNISYEIKDKTIEFDDNRNVQRAEFIVRAHMQGGRFSDGWGSSDRREKKFIKPNHDIPSTAETRAKNKACQDLLGIGEYRPGVSGQR
ncbi:hypothetical protein OSB04_020619 [Centaurea solstitialis]|uniref:Uncharacterized protein n=1 Tax=Centaurea solstitialis TaxID=347529 RepID=A0AA38WH04_9ASTR|nr:hypothetical protein OSB04_020619 [Centaurea solstitialis]